MGFDGYGEAAPLEAYDGVSVERVEQALEAYTPVLASSEGKNGAQLIDACRGVDDLPVAFAAIDMALWDRAGRRAGRPVAALLTDRPARAAPVNATLSALDRAGAATQAAAAVAAGFKCLKVKVGIGDDAGRVAAVRAAAGPEISICAWTRTAPGASMRQCGRSSCCPLPAWSSSRSQPTVWVRYVKCASGCR